jgi:adenosylhomocysteinase
MSRIRDIGLASTVGAAERAWWQVLTPVTTRIGAQLGGQNLRGRSVSCRQHLRVNTVPMLLPLVGAGVRVRFAAVNPDSTDDVAAALLAEAGIEVWAWSRMTDGQVAEGLDWLASEPADAVSDMGGELITALAERGLRPAGALEGTMTGLHHLDGVHLPFPVFNWNDIPLKDRLHNRHHVGATSWPAFCAITGLALHGRSVLVVGFGPVGRGVALHARALGALVSVAEIDPVRALEATHHGCRDVALEDGLATCSIVVTATGVQDALGPDQLNRLRPGAILVNVGHSNREIDLPWLDQHPHEPVRESVERYSLPGKDLFLINRGSLVNLAPGSGVAIDEYFDPFAAVMLQGLTWILTGGADDAPPGLQPYPAHLERQIADLARTVRT